MRSYNTEQTLEENEARVFISKSASFILLKMDFFTMFVRRWSIFLRVFLNFTVSIEGYLGTAPHKKRSSFLYKSQTARQYVVGVLDMLLVSESYVCD